jgi:hypothetical protein
MTGRFECSPDHAAAQKMNQSNNIKTGTWAAAGRFRTLFLGFSLDADVPRGEDFPTGHQPAYLYH